MIARTHCTKCGSGHIIPDLEVESDNSHELYVIVPENSKALLFGYPHVGRFRAWVCGTCGFSELYIVNADELYTAYRTNKRLHKISSPSNTLLRPASAGDEIPAEELLRANTEEEPERP